MVEKIEMENIATNNERVAVIYAALKITQGSYGRRKDEEAADTFKRNYKAVMQAIKEVAEEP